MHADIQDCPHCKQFWGVPAPRWLVCSPQSLASGWPESLGTHGHRKGHILSWLHPLEISRGLNMLCCLPGSAHVTDAQTIAVASWLMLTCSLARLKETRTIATHAPHTWLMCVCTHVCTHCPLQESVLFSLSPSLSVSSSFPVPFPLFLKKSSLPPSLCLPFCSICLSFGFLCVCF